MCLGCSIASYTGFLCYKYTMAWSACLPVSRPALPLFRFPSPLPPARPHTNAYASHSLAPSLSHTHTQRRNAFTQTVLKPICNIHNCPEIPSKSVYIMNKACILNGNRLAFGLFQNAQLCRKNQCKRTGGMASGRAQSEMCICINEH